MHVLDEAPLPFSGRPLHCRQLGVQVLVELLLTGHRIRLNVHNRGANTSGR
jgi:hypothetical protein